MCRQFPAFAYQRFRGVSNLKNFPGVLGSSLLMIVGNFPNLFGTYQRFSKLLKSIWDVLEVLGSSQYLFYIFFIGVGSFPEVLKTSQKQVKPPRSFELSRSV